MRFNNPPPPHQTVSTKIIRDMDQKPKGFGYVEFKTLDGLKDGLARTGGQLLGRNVRTSVAEPREWRVVWSLANRQPAADFGQFARNARGSTSQGRSS
jgi:hypothetical protein